MDLSQEYFELIRIYEDYNRQALELKTWSVTIGIAAILAAISAPVSVKHKRIASLVAGLFAIPFWLTETIWKLFQAAYVERLIEIERCISLPDLSCETPKIINSWQESFNDETIVNWMEIAFKPHILLPHIVLLAAGITLFFYFEKEMKTGLVENVAET